MAGSIELGKCDICGKEAPLARKYYRYKINCDCCVGSEHFEIVRYCTDCIPKPLRIVKIEIRPYNA